MLANHFNQVLLVVRHPDVDPSRVQLRGPGRSQEFGVGLGVEIEGAKGILFAEVQAEVGAARVACLSVEAVEVWLVVEVAETVLDIFISQIVVVAREVFGG
jgi:hypothetical protein